MNYFRLKVIQQTGQMLSRLRIPNYSQGGFKTAHQRQISKINIGNKVVVELAGWISGVPHRENGHSMPISFQKLL
jgi:hypothetical protein